MKRFIKLFLISILLLSLISCSTSNSKSENSGENKNELKQEKSVEVEKKEVSKEEGKEETEKKEDKKTTEDEDVDNTLFNYVKNKKSIGVEVKISMGTKESLESKESSTVNKMKISYYKDGNKVKSEITIGHDNKEDEGALVTNILYLFDEGESYEWMSAMGMGIKNKINEHETIHTIFSDIDMQSNLNVEKLMKDENIDYVKREEMYEGQKVIYIEGKSKQIGYSYIKSWISKENELPIRLELYAKDLQNEMSMFFDYKIIEDKSVFEDEFKLPDDITFTEN